MKDDSSAEVGVGFSDKVILVVSVVGFGLLSTIIYKLILMRVQSRDEFEKAEDQLLDYDEQLDRADVATLNRAQRRARAKNIMKRQRRIAPVEANNEDQDVAQEELGEDETVHHLSRKERQKAAKAAEREERRLFEEQRRESQRVALEAAQREKKERERLEAERIEEERKQRLQEKEAREQAEFEKWNTFLVSRSGDDTMTVRDFVEYMEQHKSVSIDDLADRFQTTSKQVRMRIRELVTSCRITGVVDDDNFVYVTHDEMTALASLICEREQVTLNDVVNSIDTVVQL